MPADHDVKDEIIQHLEANDTCALATLNKKEEQPCVATVNYFSKALDVFVIMDIKSLKCQNIKSHKKVAVVVDDENTGSTLQFIGIASEINKLDYVKEHPRLADPSMTLIIIVPTEMKLTHQNREVKSLKLAV